MELKRADKSDYKKMKALYLEAFPADERAPFWLMWRKAQKNKAEVYSLMDGEKWVGLAYVVCHGDLAYLFYLAIERESRGKGYGSKAIACLKKKYEGRRLFLALETLDEKAENYEQRVKRHDFYKRCGLSDLPYHLKEASVIYSIMGVGGAVQPEEYQAMFDEYLGRFLRRLIDMRFVE